ncbi:MCE family protein [Nocardioides sp. NPDC127514]|uniref:MCE family protein n=1 Tax=unclassified Nocardioides TaxID=2615069 RepID=UPI00332A1A49
MTRARTDRDLTRIALIGIASIAVVLAGVLNWQRLPLLGADGHTFTAEFADASGLVAGEDVRVAGVKVGEVTGVELGRGKVLAAIEVEGVEVGDRSTARIEIRTLLGQHYVSLAPKGQALADGGVIPLSRTTTPVDIVPTLNQLGETSAELDAEKVAEAFDAMSAVLEETAPELRPTLNALTDISEAVNDRDAQIRQLFANTRKVSGMIAARDQDLQALVRSSAQVLTMLDEHRAVLDELITGTELLATQVRAIVAENQELLEPTLRKLGAVLKVLRENREQVDQIFDYGAQYAVSFTSVGGSGRYLDASVGVPQGFAVCAAIAEGDLGALLSGVMTEINKAVNNANRPCLPLGPATSGTDGGEG